MFFNWLAGVNTPPWVKDAKSRPFLEGIGTKIEALLPADAENAILDKLNKAGVNAPATDNQGDNDTDQDTAPNAPAGTPPANPPATSN